MSAPEQPSSTGPIRGAIKTAISTSTEALVAGQPFSIFVTVQNPFEVPLTLHRVATYLPTEFIDINQSIQDARLAEVDEHIAEVQESASKAGLNISGSSIILKKRRDPYRFLRNITFSVGPLDIKIPEHRQPTFAAVARDVSDVKLEVQSPLLSPLLKAVWRPARETKPPSEADAAREEAARKVYVEQLNNEIKRLENAHFALESPPSSSTMMQAGNSKTRVFTLRSRQVIWFRPASYRLQIEVEYEIGGVRNIDTIDHVLQVKSSLWSMVLGSLVGGVGGWFTSKGSTAVFSFADGMSMMVSIVFAVIAVVLFARKKDVQPLIAVEDFWGGVALGFLVAYSGPKILSGVLGPGAAGTVPPK